MALASLIHSVDDCKEGYWFLNVRGSARSAGTGIYISAQLVAAKSLTSRHYIDCELELSKTQYGFYRLAPDNPFLTVEQRSKLDARGCLPAGSNVDSGDLLASAVYVRTPLKGEARVPAGMQRVRNECLEAPPGSRGFRVESVEVLSRRELPRTTSVKTDGLVQFRLVRERDLACGDSLACKDVEIGRVSALNAELGDGIDLELDALGTRLAGLNHGEVQRIAIGKSEPTAEEYLQARGMGPYSLINSQPLGGKARSGGLPVSIDHFRWLREHGMLANLSEFTSLKCDDRGSRNHVRAAHRGLGEFPEAGMPESLRLMQLYLWAMGLHATLKRDGDHVDLTLRAATRDELLSTSDGVVTRAETLAFDTLKPTAGGLFCERVFGPETGDRRERFGHIVLCQPVVPYQWRVGSPSVLEVLLAPYKIPPADLEKIVCGELRVVRTQSGQLEFVPAETQTSGPGLQDLGLGGNAIRALLEAVDPATIPQAMRGQIYHLVQDQVLVLPPDIRPLVPLYNGNWATSDLNDLYRRVINRNNRLRKLIELKAPHVILVNEHGQLQKSVDALFANSQLKPTLLSEGRPLVGLSQLFADTRRRTGKASASTSVHAPPSS